MTSVEGYEIDLKFLEIAFNIDENSSTPTSTASQGATQTLFALQNMKSNVVDALEACFVQLSVMYLNPLSKHSRSQNKVNNKPVMVELQLWRYSTWGKETSSTVNKF